MITLRTIRRRNRDYFRRFSLETMVRDVQGFIDQHGNANVASLEVEAMLTEIKRRVSNPEYNAIILKINKNFWPAKLDE